MGKLCSSFGRSAGYPVEAVPFCSAGDFLEAFSGGSFDLVFMDIYMEGMDGVAAALEMRKSDSGCLLVFLTSSTDFMPDAFSCHAFEYVTKPFSEKRIFDVLADAVKVLPQEQKCLTVPESSRYFCLTSQVRHGNQLYIVSTNSFDGKVRKGKDGYLSTKRNGNGIGLSAIAATAEKYGGSAKASNSGTEFFVDIVLKI